MRIRAEPVKYIMVVNLSSMRSKEDYLKDVRYLGECVSQVRFRERIGIIVEVRMSHNLLMLLLPSPKLSLILALNSQPLNQESIISLIFMGWHTEFLSTFYPRKFDLLHQVEHEILPLCHVDP